MAIVKKNINPCHPPKLNEAIAGPGHKPDRPQPIPNIIDPMISGLFNFCSVFSGNLSVKIGFFILFVMFQVIAIGIIAPECTYACVGSQFPYISSDP